MKGCAKIRGNRGSVMIVAICDENEQECLQYSKIIMELAKKNNLHMQLQTYTSVKELQFELEGDEALPELLFLDVFLPGMQGVETARALREENVDCEMIFLTRSKDYVFDAFDVNAFHYIVKDETPIEKIEEIFLKAAKKVKRKNQEVITVACAGESRIIPVADIRYFEVKNYILTVYYGQEESFDFYSTLGKIENSLLGRNMVRIHRSFLVSIYAMREITRREVVLKTGEKLPVSRNYWNNLKEQLDKIQTV